MEEKTVTTLFTQINETQKFEDVITTLSNGEIQEGLRKLEQLILQPNMVPCAQDSLNDTESPQTNIYAALWNLWKGQPEASIHLLKCYVEEMNNNQLQLTLHSLDHFIENVDRNVSITAKLTGFQNGQRVFTEFKNDNDLELPVINVTTFKKSREIVSNLRLAIPAAVELFWQLTVEERYFIFLASDLFADMVNQVKGQNGIYNKNFLVPAGGILFLCYKMGEWAGIFSL